MHLPFNAAVTVGIDVTDKYIRAVQLRKKHNGYLIEKLGMQSLPNHVFLHNKVQHWEDFTSALSSLVQTLSLRTKPIALALRNELIQIQCLKLPKDSSMTIIEKEIHSHLRQHNLADRFAFDFAIKSLAHECEIIVALAEKTYAQHYVEAVESIGLSVRVLDIESYALQRAVQMLLGKPIYDHQAILYIRENTANLIAFAHDVIAFNQIWPVQSEMKFYQECELQLQQLSDVLPALKTIAVCCAHQLKQKLSEVVKQCALQFTDVYAFALPPQQIATGQIHDFFIAYGLACRGNPIW